MFGTPLRFHHISVVTITQHIPLTLVYVPQTYQAKCALKDFAYSTVWNTLLLVNCTVHILPLHLGLSINIPPQEHLQWPYFRSSTQGSTTTFFFALLLLQSICHWYFMQLWICLVWSPPFNCRLKKRKEVSPSQWALGRSKAQSQREESTRFWLPHKHEQMCTWIHTCKYASKHIDSDYVCTHNPTRKWHNHSVTIEQYWAQTRYSKNILWDRWGKT